MKSYLALAWKELKAQKITAIGSIASQFAVAYCI